MAWYELHKNDPDFKKRKRIYDKLYRHRVSPHLKYYYGITAEEYKVMLTRQGSACAICGRPETARNQYGRKKLAVDHDHATGRIRGLLCAACNRAIGLFEDDADRMRRAAKYLMKGDR